MAKYAQVYPEESISTVAETMLLESRMEVVVEGIVVQKEDMKLPKPIILERKLSQSVIKRDDDWFLLLDVVPRETTYIPPGTHSLQISFIFFTCNLSPQTSLSSKMLEEDFNF